MFHIFTIIPDHISNCFWVAAKVSSPWKGQRKELVSCLFKHGKGWSETTVLDGQSNHRGIPFEVT